VPCNVLIVKRHINPRIYNNNNNNNNLDLLWKSRVVEQTLMVVVMSVISGSNSSLLIIEKVIMLMVQASSRRRSKAVKSRVTGSSDEETSRSTEPSRKCSTDSGRTLTTSTGKSARALMTSSDSESSSSSSDDEAGAARHQTAAKPPTATAASKSRLITSSDSDDSSDDESVTLLKNRVTPDKSRKTPAATSTPLQRHSIYTSSDNDDDSDSDSISGTPLKKVKPSLSMSTPSASKPQSKKPAQSSTKKPTHSTPSGSSKTISKPYVPRESSTDSDAVKSSKSVMKDTKKQHKMGDRDSHADSVLGSGGQSLKKDVKKPAKSTTDKPVPHHHVSSLFGDALAKSASHTKVGLKPAVGAKEEKVVKKDSSSSRSTDTHKSTSSVAMVSSDRAKQKSSHTDMSSVKSKHSISESRHAPKSSSGSAEKKLESERPVKSGHDVAHENISRKILESEMLRTKKVKRDDRSGERCGTAEAESDESPLIRPGNIFEKMEKQDSSSDKCDEARMFGHADTAAHLCNMASEIAVFMPESDDEDDREPIVETAKLSIERLKEESSKEETIEEAVKAIIEFTKEPSTPPLSSSKATDSELQEDTSGEAVDDDIGLSDDVGELNAAIGNLIEKELEPVGEDDLTSQNITGNKASEPDSSVSSPTHYRTSSHGGLAEPKNELSPFVGTNSGGKEELSSVKREVDSVARHIQTPAHDEQNVTSFMSRLEKATADVVDFAAISAAAAASRKLPEKVSSEVIPCSKPEVSSRLFASAIASPPVKTEDEKPGVVKKEECSEQVESVKPEPPEFPLSTRIFSSSKQAEVHGVSSAEKGPAGAGGEPASGEDSSTMADLYEFKDDDDDEANTRQKEFVLHKRSRKRHADSESNDAADVVDLKKLRGSHVKSDQHETASAVTTEQCPVTTTSVLDSQPVSSQSSWRTNMDLVIDAVARGEFERGDDFNYYSTQNAAASSSTGRGRRGRGTSRDDTARKPVPASTPGCMPSSVPNMSVEAFNAALQRSMSAVVAGTSSTPAGGRCSPKLLLSSMPSPQQLQQLHRSLSVSCECLCLLYAINSNNVQCHLTVVKSF